jgi:hypothetical protein
MCGEALCGGGSVIYLAGVCVAGAVVSFQLRLQYLGWTFLVLSLASLAA